MLLKIAIHPLAGIMPSAVNVPVESTINTMVLRVGRAGNKEPNQLAAAGELALSAALLTITNAVDAAIMATAVRPAPAMITVLSVERSIFSIAVGSMHFSPLPLARPKARRCSARSLSGFASTSGGSTAGEETELTTRRCAGIIRAGYI